MSTTLESLPIAYRPKSFDEVVGQESVVQVLRALVARNTLPQQLLFSGPSGTGKTTLARLTAAAMLCETPMGEREQGNPCGTCPACRDILWPDRNHADVMEIDAASNGRVDEIRELANQVQLMPQRAEHRVVIIDEVHGLSTSGGSAFLKLLEEPPAHVVFLLATTDPEKMLLTNRSRVTELPLRRPTPEQIAQNLKRVAKDKQWPLSDQLAAAVTEATDPQLGVRGSLMTLQKISPLLESGEGTDQQAYELLGAATPTLIADIRNAYLAGDRPAAAEASRRATATTSSATTLNALLRLTRTDVDAALKAGDPVALDRALSDQETLIEAQSSRKPLEWTALRLALSRNTQPTQTQAQPQPPATPTQPVEAAQRFMRALTQINQETADFVTQNSRLVTLNEQNVGIELSALSMNVMRRSPHARPLIDAAKAAGVQLHPKVR